MSNGKLAFATIAIIGLMLGLGTPPAKAATQYDIHLDRKSNVGDVYQTDASYEAHEDDVVQTGKKVSGSEGIHIVGREEILLVNMLGAETSAKITLTQFQELKDGKTKTLGNAGSVLTINRASNKKIIAKLDDRNLNATQANDLVEALDLDIDAANVGDDERLATPQTPQYPLATWPINQDLVAAWLDAGITLTPQDVAGKTQFTAVRMVNKRPALTITSRISIDKLKISDKLPKTMKQTGGSQTAILSEQIMSDDVSPPLWRTLEFDGTFVAEGNAKNGSTQRVNGTTKSISNCKRTLLESKSASAEDGH